MVKLPLPGQKALLHPASGDRVTVPLGEVITLQRGFDLPSQDRQPGPIPIVSSSGVTGTHCQAKVTGPGVVTGRYGTIGQVFYIAEDFWPLNTTLFVKDFKGNDPHFVSYLLRTIDYLSVSDKSSVPGVNRNHLHLIPVSIPPVADQCAIAAILGALDDKIELNRRMNETLEAIARALFKSWFVDFDPVRAKMEGREPAGMDAETAALFPDSLTGDALGTMPSGWSRSSIGMEVTVVGGSTPSTHEPEFWEGGNIPWATPKDLSTMHDPILTDTDRHITASGLSRISSGLLPPGTVLLSSRAPIGYVALAIVGVAINQGFIGMICDRVLPSHYVMHWVRANMDLIKNRANGTTFLEVSKQSFRPLPVIVPPVSILRRFTSVVSPMYDLIAVHRSETETLAQSRDWLLPRLLSGHLRLNVVEQEIEAAV